MEMLIDFPGGSRVDAHFGAFTVATDQPPVSRIVAMSFCEPRSWTRVLSS